MTSLVSIGGAALRVIGLNPSRIGQRSENRVPAKPTFKGMHYQLTGMGEERIRLQFQTAPLIMNGLDALEVLRLQHRQQAVVPWLRMGSAYGATVEGLVVVQSLDVDEERIHPFTGRARIVHGECEMIVVARSAAASAGITVGMSLSVSLGGSVSVSASASVKVGFT